MDKVKKRFIITIVMCACMVFIVGWGIINLIRTINLSEKSNQNYSDTVQRVEENEKKAGKKIDTEKLISELLEKVIFDAELNLLETSVAEGMIETTAGATLKTYMGNGTYADEIVVITAKNEEDAEKNQEFVERHLLEMKEQFNDYLPKEAKKIEKAVQVRCGCYVIVCVTSDYETAQETIASFVS